MLRRFFGVTARTDRALTDTAGGLVGPCRYTIKSMQSQAWKRIYNLKVNRILELETIHEQDLESGVDGKIMAIRIRFWIASHF